MIQAKNIWRERNGDVNAVNQLSKSLNISKTLANLLCLRGYTELDSAERFLYPKLQKMHDPFLMKDMDVAVERILRNKEQGKITIYGDYDVDGITSTSSLFLFLQSCGFAVDYYIPNRLQEGYGINNDALRKIKDEGADLVISVDTGITAMDQAEYAKSINLDLIITDHHETQGEIPDALAVVNPKRKDCQYPFDMLAGVGVTFKLIHAMAIRLNMLDEIWKYLDIVAIGTVADIVPLKDENRIIVKEAFKTMTNSWNVGLDELMKVSGFKQGDDMSSSFIGFRIGPRLNAAGRLGDAKRGVELFTTREREKAAIIAKELNDENLNRQEMEQTILEDCIKYVDANVNLDKTKIIVVAHENWHHGVIGIVASRITEKYYRPSIILSIEEGIASGSARSVEGFSIFDAINSNKALLDKFGGHEMAAGMSLKVENVEEFRNALNNYATEHMTEDVLIPKMNIDISLKEKVDLKLIEELELLEPFGAENPQPVVKIQGKIKDFMVIGKQKNHLKLSLMQHSNSLGCIGFNIGDYAYNITEGVTIETVGVLQKNVWNQRVSPQLMIRDMQTIQIQETLRQPTREEFAALYRQLHSVKRLKNNEVSINALILGIESKYHLVLGQDLLEIMLKIFSEVGMLRYKIYDGILHFIMNKQEKVDFTQSETFQSLPRV